MRSLLFLVPIVVLGSTQPASGQLHGALVLCDNNPSCTYAYVHGALYKTANIPGASVTVAAFDTGKYFRVEVLVSNRGNDQMDVLPEFVVLKEITPKAKVLPYIPTEKIIHSEDRRLAWRSALAAGMAGMARQQSTTQSNTYGTVNAFGSGGYANGSYSSATTSTTYAPDYAARERVAEASAEARSRLNDEERDLSESALQGTTLKPGQEISGSLFYKRDKHARSLLIEVRARDEYVAFPFEQRKR
jgi:hypothetical protein